MNRRFILVDGSSCFYRAFYAVRGLSTSAGLPTNAVFGFTNMLMRLLKEHGEDALAVVFDAPGRTFRDDIFADYKATRESMPEDLVRQLPYLKAVPGAFNVETVERAGVEADDVIGTLALRGMEAGRDVVIVTGDKDFMQLVTKEAGAAGPGITLYDDMKQRRIGIAEVQEKFGVPPERVVDILSLTGDSSDNIPGVRGIGPTFAAALVREHGPVEEILAHLDRVKPRLRAMLETGRENALMSKRLATIRTDLDVPFDESRFARKAPDGAKLAALFKELEFDRLLQSVEADLPKRQSISFERYRTVLQRTELETLAADLRKAKILSVDLETTSAEPMRAKIVGITVCAREGESAYIPVGHAYEGAPAQLPLEDVLETLRPALTDPGIPKVGQNLKYDALVLARHGVRLSPIGFDTMVGAYLVNPDDGPFNLETLARKWLAHDVIRFEDVTGKGKDQVTFDKVPVETARDYSGEDADAALRLTGILEKKVRDDGMGELLESVEIPLIDILVDLERNGVRIDEEYFSSLAGAFDKKAAMMVAEVHRLAGEEFNLDSPKQLQKILFEKLGLPRGKRTKTGFSTDVSVLEKLAGAHDLPRVLLEYRMISKLKGTYVEALPRLVNPETGRIHTSYNQAVAATGRLSSSDPNLQNIPIRTPEGRLIRKGFVPERGRVYVGADYSQVELRVLAHLSGDPGLQGAFREGKDVHSATSEELFGKVDEESRRRAKTINFGIIYGMSAFGLAQRLGIDPGTAQKYIDLYFSRYPRVKAYLEETLEGARRAGYVRTLFGRRRYVPDVRSQNLVIRGAAERVATNAPIQGTAADLMKMAMASVWRRLRGGKAFLILQVHDELMVEAPKAEADAVAGILRTEMENVHPLAVPLRVDVTRGANWADME